MLQKKKSYLLNQLDMLFIILTQICITFSVFDRNSYLPQAWFIKPELTIALKQIVPRQMVTYLKPVTPRIIQSLNYRFQRMQIDSCQTGPTKCLLF